MAAKVTCTKQCLLKLVCKGAQIRGITKGVVLGPRIGGGRQVGYVSAVHPVLVLKVPSLHLSVLPTLRPFLMAQSRVLC